MRPIEIPPATPKKHHHAGDRHQQHRGADVVGGAEFLGEQVVEFILQGVTGSLIAAVSIPIRNEGAGPVASGPELVEIDRDHVGAEESSDTLQPVALAAAEIADQGQQEDQDQQSRGDCTKTIDRALLGNPVIDMQQDQHVRYHTDHDRREAKKRRGANPNHDHRRAAAKVGAPATG